MFNNSIMIIKIFVKFDLFLSTNFSENG